MEERYEADKFSTSALTITVEDSNDTPPQFSSDIYRVSIQEHSSQGSVMTQVSASDDDQVCNHSAV